VGDHKARLRAPVAAHPVGDPKPDDRSHLVHGNARGIAYSHRDVDAGAHALGDHAEVFELGEDAVEVLVLRRRFGQMQHHVGARDAPACSRAPRSHRFTGVNTFWHNTGTTIGTTFAYLKYGNVRFSLLNG